jgi:hypothetical protein
MAEGGPGLRHPPAQEIVMKTETPPERGFSVPLPLIRSGAAERSSAQSSIPGCGKFVGAIPDRASAAPAPVILHRRRASTAVPPGPPQFRLYAPVPPCMFLIASWKQVRTTREKNVNPLATILSATASGVGSRERSRRLTFGVSTLRSTTMPSGTITGFRGAVLVCARNGSMAQPRFG